MSLAQVLRLYDNWRAGGDLTERDARLLAERELMLAMPGLSANGAAEILADALALRASTRTWSSGPCNLQNIPRNKPE